MADGSAVRIEEVAAVDPTIANPDVDVDVVVVGGGAAGLSAALVLGRARRQVAVVDSGRPRNAPARHMHGFLGSDGLPPSVLLARGREEVTAYGVQLLSGAVGHVRAHPSAAKGLSFSVEVGGRRTVTARRVLVATGLRDELPDVPGLLERWGRDVLHCPYCHGFEVRDQPLAVLAGHPTNITDSLTHAHLLRQWSRDVVFLANNAALDRRQRQELRLRGIVILDEAVEGLVVEDDQVSGVKLTGRVVPCTGVFLRPSLVPNDAILTDIGCDRDQDGWTVVDASGAASVPGIWAAGNVIDPRAQVITAAGQGSAAAISINHHLVSEDITLATRKARLKRGL